MIRPSERVYVLLDECRGCVSVTEGVVRLVRVETTDDGDGGLVERQTLDVEMIPSKRRVTVRAEDLVSVDGPRWDSPMDLGRAIRDRLAASSAPEAVEPPPAPPMPPPPPLIEAPPDDYARGRQAYAAGLPREAPHDDSGDAFRRGWDAAAAEADASIPF